MTPLDILIAQSAIDNAPTTDPYWSYVDFLLTGNGTNASTPTTDTTGKTLTWGGDARILTNGSAPFYGSWLAFDGAGDYISATIPAIGTGTFTLRAWLTTSTTPSGTSARIMRIGPNNDGGNAQILVNTSSKVRVDFGSTSILTSTTSVTNGSSHHIEVGRSAGGTVYLFIDGVLEASYSSSSNISMTSLQIGGDTTVSGSYLSGALTDVQVYRGVCLHTGTFTPPTSGAFTS